MLPFLRMRFTCYLTSTRGGLSGKSTDLSPQRRVEDVTAFIESIGEPVYLFGESDGGALALGAEARTAAVSAGAVHEPPVFEMLDEETGGRFDHVTSRARAAATEGSFVEATRIFCDLVANDDELASLSALGYSEEVAHHFPPSWPSSNSKRRRAN